MLIHIDNSSNHVAFTEGITVPLGYQTNIIVNRLNIKKKEQPYSDCLNEFKESRSFDPFLYNKMIKRNPVYQQKSCYDICAQLTLREQCNCYDLFKFPIDDTDTPCLSLSDLFCIVNAYMQFLQSDFRKTCNKYCPLECESFNYKYRTSLSKYPSNTYSKLILEKSHIKMNLSADEIKERCFCKHLL